MQRLARCEDFAIFILKSQAMKKITKRDVKFFFLGILTVLLLELVLNWEENVKAFEAGFKGGYEEAYQPD